MAEFVGDYSRAAEVIGRGVVDGWLRGWCTRVFGDQLSGGIDEDGLLADPTLRVVNQFPYTLAFASAAT